MNYKDLPKDPEYRKKFPKICEEIERDHKVFEKECLDFIPEDLTESRLKEAQMKMLAPSTDTNPISIPDSPGTQTTEEDLPLEESPLITLIGDGEMRYTCLMVDDMVFSANSGECPVCGMNLVEMDDDHTKRLDNLQNMFGVKRIKN